MSGVFGSEVNAETMKTLPQFEGKKSFVKTDRAIAALDLKNANRKDLHAAQYLEEVLHKKNDGNKAGVRCMIYNATGDTVTLVGSWNKEGKVGSSPYPIIIQNGQWGVFNHAKFDDKEKGCSGGVVYKGKIDDAGKLGELAFAWKFSEGDSTNQCYVDIYDRLVFGLPEVDVNKRDEIEKGKADKILKFDKGLSEGRQYHTVTYEGFFISGCIANSAHPVFEGVMSLSIVV